MSAFACITVKNDKPTTGNARIEINGVTLSGCTRCVVDIRVDDLMRANLEVFVRSVDIENAVLGEMTAIGIDGTRYRVVEISRPGQEPIDLRTFADLARLEQESAS